MTWHPRGEPTWPDWKSARPGTRLEHVRSKRQGTLVLAKSGRAGNSYAVVDWDRGPDLTPARGRVVAPAYDLRPID